MNNLFNLVLMIFLSAFAAHSNKFIEHPTCNMLTNSAIHLEHKNFSSNLDYYDNLKGLGYSVLIQEAEVLSEPALQVIFEEGHYVLYSLKKHAAFYIGRWKTFNEIPKCKIYSYAPINNIKMQEFQETDDL